MDTDQLQTLVAMLIAKFGVDGEVYVERNYFEELGDVIQLQTKGSEEGLLLKLTSTKEQ